MRIEILSRKSPELDLLIHQLEQMPLPLLRPLARAMAVAAQEVVGEAVKNRFTGQGPFPPSQNKLGVKTGRLRRSIRATRPQINARTGEVSVGFGSNVVYFAIHEFGFKGQVHVKGHTRRNAGPQKLNSRGRLTKASQAKLKKVLTERRQGKGAVSSQVKPHGRRLNVPARRPLGTQLEAITTTAAFSRNLKRELQTLLKSS